MCYISFEAKWDERVKGVKFDLSSTDHKQSLTVQGFRSRRPQAKKKASKLKPFASNGRKK